VHPRHDPNHKRNPRKDPDPAKKVEPFCFAVVGCMCNRVGIRIANKAIEGIYMRSNAFNTKSGMLVCLDI
jgi:hypothetical protein